MDNGSAKEYLEYGKVLERTVDLVTEDGSLPFGDALDQAIRDLGIPVPTEIKVKIIVAAFKVVTSGFPTDIEA